LAAEVLDDMGTRVVADAVGVPPGACQQVLHPVRRRVTGMLGDRPAVLARQFGQQAQHERPRPAPRLHAAEPGPDLDHQLIEYPQPAARVYAVASGHQQIITSRHKRDDQTVAAPSPVTTRRSSLAHCPGVP
jgi:hypothetical protein